MTTWALGGPIVALSTAILITNAASGHLTPNRGFEKCTVSVVDQQPITLTDGRAVLFDAGNIASAGNSVLILGTPMFVWPRGATKESAPVGDSAIGILRDGRGRVTIVPSPLGARHVYYPRAARADDSTWHVVFVTGRLGAPGAPNPAMFDTASLWYGRFDGRAWTAVKRIGSATDARLSTSSSSALVVAGRALTFVYSFDRSSSLKSNAAGNQGLVAVHGDGVRWVFDTLPTWEGPNYVQIASGPGSSTLTVAIAQAYFEDHRPHRASLFLAQYDSAWHAPRLMVPAIPTLNGRYSVIAPAIVVTDQRIIIGWQTLRGNAIDTVQIEWAGLHSLGDSVTPHRIARGLAFDTFGLVALTPQRFLWLTRDGDSRTSLSVFLTSGSETTALGSVSVPLSNFAPLTTALSDSTVLVVTGGIGMSASEPPATSYFTRLRLSCPRVS